HRVRCECHPNDADRLGISQPGTIVDKVIGDPFLYNLLFQSQASLKGTSCFLKDETNHTVDDPQKIANSVCSASQRATVSLWLITASFFNL
ncbi:hypothetical protein PPACK8108_LOCUS13990, partial [Phakopsora pachyrhizi]